MNILFLCADRGIPLDGHKGAAAHVRQAAALGLVQAGDGGVVGEQAGGARQDLALGIDRDLPVQGDGGVPLHGLGLGVEVAQPLLDAAVAPGEQRVERREDAVELGVGRRRRGHGFFSLRVRRRSRPRFSSRRWRWASGFRSCA